MVVRRPLGAVLVLSCALFSSAPAALIFTYDFTGSKDTNYLAANQANPQPANATFGDFIRQPSLAATDSNVLGSKNFTASASMDPTQYEGFSITAAVGYSLNLTQITFDINNPSDGPGHFQLALYVNGSATAYEVSPDYATQGISTTLTWDFTDLTGTNNASTVEFRFFGWGSPSAGAHLQLDNVATFGTIGTVAESSNFWTGAVPILATLQFCLRSARLRYKKLDLHGRALAAAAWPNTGS
jgi:hypothetical protein